MSDSSLRFVSGCPEEWSESTGEVSAYDEGDMVSLNGLVFRCRSCPYCRHCGQAGYEPLEDQATPGAWKVRCNRINPVCLPAFVRS